MKDDNIMEVTISKTYKVACCNDCPYKLSHTKGRESIFVSEKYTPYCSREIFKKVDEKDLDKFTFIGDNWYRKLEKRHDIIPNWCPEKKEQEKPFTFGYGNYPKNVNYE